MLKQKNIKLILLYIVIILQPVVAQITAIMVRNGTSQVTLGMIFNGLILLFGIVYTVFLSKSKYKKDSIIYFILLFIFCLLFYLFKHQKFNIDYFLREMIFMFKYLYFPIITVFFVNLLDSENVKLANIENSIKISMIIYCFLIFIAELSGTSYLSYQNSYSGKMGWFYSANEIGTLLVILLPYMFLNFKDHKKMNLVLIVVTISIVLFIGTKTSFLGVILLLLLLLIYFFIKVDFKKKIILFITLIGLIISLFIINPPALKNMKQSFNYYWGFSKSDDINQVPSNASLSFLIFSERAVFFEEAYNRYIDSTVADKLLGIGFSNNDPNTNYQNHLVEMDFFDIFFKYGIIGFLIYVCPITYMLYNLIKNFIKNKIKLDFSDIIYLYVVTLTLMISFLAGHVLGSPSVSIFLALTFAIIFYRTSRRLN